MWHVFAYLSIGTVLAVIQLAILCARYENDFTHNQKADLTVFMFVLYPILLAWYVVYFSCKLIYHIAFWIAKPRRKGE